MIVYQWVAAFLMVSLGSGAEIFWIEVSSQPELLLISAFDSGELGSLRHLWNHLAIVACRTGDTKSAHVILGFDLLPAVQTIETNRHWGAPAILLDIVSRIGHVPKRS